MCVCDFIVVFFFKQKTAYEMRISDWSSDVCSSDLYIVLEPGLTPLEKFQLLTEDELLDAQDEYGEDAFSAGIGAEAIRVLLENLDLEQERTDLMEELATTKSELKRSEEHTSELQSLMRISYAVFCLQTKNTNTTI